MILEQTLEMPLINKVLQLFAEDDNLSRSLSEDNRAFETTDGGVITQKEINMAVDRGAGMFIGGYFVGVSDTYRCYSSSSF